MKPILFCMGMILLSHGAFAQHYWDIPGMNQITISDSGRIIHAFYYDQAKEIRVHNFLDYYWVKSGKVYRTEGGYGGKVLDGLYEEYYPNKNLFQQGQFHKGLKDKVWKEWFDNGIQKSIVTWRNGLKEGFFEIFDSNQNILEKGTYKNNFLDGPLERMNANGKLEQVYFEKGKLSKPDTSGYFLRKWHELNVFGAKNSKSAGNK